MISKLLFLRAGFQFGFILFCNFLHATSLEEVDGRGLESLFFCKKVIRIIPLESITQLKIPVHRSQHKLCYTWLYFLSFLKILFITRATKI